mmetsp:Transcript_1847/g.4037  ORF Transcript_1847/g.4037 Transcript_1847/m.4037 type:complete len:215 (-) Transcript_1847:4264-4908(-)
MSELENLLPQPCVQSIMQQRLFKRRLDPVDLVLKVLQLPLAVGDQAPVLRRFCFSTPRAEAERRGGCSLDRVEPAMRIRVVDVLDPPGKPVRQRHRVRANAAVESGSEKILSDLAEKLADVRNLVVLDCRQAGREELPRCLDDLHAALDDLPRVIGGNHPLPAALARPSDPSPHGDRQHQGCAEFETRLVEVSVDGVHQSSHSQIFALRLGRSC